MRKIVFIFGLLFIIFITWCNKTQDNIQKNYWKTVNSLDTWNNLDSLIKQEENENMESDLIDATENWDIKTVKILLEGLADNNIQDNLWYTALTTASDNWNTEIAKLLLESWVDPDIKTND